MLNFLAGGYMSIFGYLGQDHPLQYQTNRLPLTSWVQQALPCAAQTAGIKYTAASFDHIPIALC